MTNREAYKRNATIWEYYLLHLVVIIPENEKFRINQKQFQRSGKKKSRKGRVIIIQHNSKIKEKQGKDNTTRKQYEKLYNTRNTTQKI